MKGMELIASKCYHPSGVITITIVFEVRTVLQCITALHYTTLHYADLRHTAHCYLLILLYRGIIVC